MATLLTKHLNSWLTPLLIAGLLMAGYFVEHHYNNDYLEARHLEVRTDMGLVRDRLQQSIENDIQLVRGLVSLIASRPDLNQQKFARAAVPLFGSGSNLRNIGAAPGMVIRMMYLLKGNEAAIGLDYRKTSGQAGMAEKARTSEKMILAGPLPLVQGGTGLIGRFPVFTLDKQGDRHFWGLLSAVIDADALYRRVGLLDAAQPLALAIRDIAEPGGKILFGDPRLFDEQPETLRIELPGRTWQLAAVLKRGWPTRAHNILEIRLWLIISGILILIPFLFLLHTLNKRYQLEGALRASREKYQRLVDNMGDKFIVYSHKADSGEMLHVSNGIKAIAGKSWDDVIGRPWSDVVDWHPASLEQGQGFVNRMINGEANFVQYEMEFDHPDGNRHTVLVSSHPYRDEQGTITHIDGIIEDITERKQAEQALRASEEKLRGLYELAPVGIALAGMDGQFIEFNKAFANICGYPEAELKRLNYWQLTPEQYAGNEQQQLELLGKSGYYGPYEKVYRRKDGSLVPVQLNGMLIKGSNGQSYIWSIVEDITDRKQSEEMLRLAATAFETHEAIIITDPRGTIVSVNPAFTEITGYESDEAIGQSTKILASGKHDIRFFNQMWATLIHNERWEGEIINRRKNGELYTEQLTVTAVKDREGNIRNYIGVFSDISERKKLEDQLRQTQKMEAVGTLVGGIAHEFNNMLVGISGNIYLAKEKSDRGGDTYHKLERAETMCFRAAGMIRKLLVFAGKDFIDHKQQTIDMKPWLDEGLKLAGSALTAKTQLLCESNHHEELLVTADPTQLQQILVNLLNNARDASAECENPRIRIALDAGTVSNEFLQRHKRFNGNKYVCLTVQDNGTGIKEEKLEKIFEPFFTTKEVGKGTGLGLSVIQGLVQSLYGAIEVESEAGKGTSFHIYLPRHHQQKVEPPDTDQKQSHQPVERGHGETILFADDEPEVLKMTSEVLEELGYNVLPVHNGEEATRLFEMRKGSIDMLLLDVMMPQLSGPEAARKIRASAPDIPLLFCTGYSADEMRDEMDDLSNFHLIGKPMQISELSQIIRKLLTAK